MQLKKLPLDCGVFENRMLSVSRVHFWKFLFICCSAFLVACQSAKSTQQTTSYAPQAAASIVELTFESAGQRMPALAYLAAGNGPHPTVLLLHGYPGNEKNLDVAQALRRKGWNVVFFHYRGAWGAEGEFSFRNAEQDVQAALSYIRAKNNANRLRIDPQRVSLVGHSMGGHMAIAGLVDNPQVQCAVAYDGANLGASGKGLFNSPEAAARWSAYGDTLFMLKGWSGAKAIAEVNQYGAELDLVARAHKVAQRPVLLIAADTQVIPVDLHIKPLFNALQQHSDRAQYLLIDDDHSFSNSRLELIVATQVFLDSNCRG